MTSGQYRLALASILLVQISGFVLLWMRIPAAPPRSLPAPAVPQIMPGSARSAVRIPQDQMLQQAIQSVLKQELAPYLSQLAARARMRRAVAGAPGVGVAPANPASRRAMQQSDSIVDRALASGVWTNADSAALLRVAPDLSESQREKLLDRIFGAINTQQMKPAGSLPSL